MEKLLTIQHIKGEDLINDLLEIGDDQKINILIPINSKIIYKHEYDILNDKTNASSENIKNTSGSTKAPEIPKIGIKRTCEEMLKENLQKQNSKTDINKKFKMIPKPILGPEKKMYSNWSISKLEEEVKKIESSIQELEVNNSDDKKNKEIDKFNRLTKKWLKISQDAILTLLEMFPQNLHYEKNTIKSVIEHFKLDKEMLKYDEENECFED